MYTVISLARGGYLLKMWVEQTESVCTLYCRLHRPAIGQVLETAASSRCRMCSCYGTSVLHLMSAAALIAGGHSHIPGHDVFGTAVVGCMLRTMRVWETGGWVQGDAACGSQPGLLMCAPSPANHSSQLMFILEACLCLAAACSTCADGDVLKCSPRSMSLSGCCLQHLCRLRCSQV